MRISSTIKLLLLAAALLYSVPASAQNCNTGSAEVDLQANNVRARIYNNGHLFWKGSGNVYTVPKNGNANAIFASGIWLGGMVGGEMRFAGTDYGPFEFFPGPLDDNGNPPSDCTPYDRIYSITRADLEAFEAGEPTTSDIVDWPWQLGAPVVDGDGNPDNYNLEGGDRPELTGDQTVWFIMNDAAGPHGWSNTSPLGLEVQVTAFAFRTADALNNTTFYKYTLIYKGNEPLTNAYFGIWSDPDLGNAADDFVGADTSLGMGFVYNGDDFDDGAVGYGSTPPALGYDYFQGPLVNNDGIDNDGDGEIDEEDERIAMTKFVYYNNDSSPQGNPFNGAEAYGYLRGIWRDGQPITLGGTGYGGNTPTDVMFPGDPVTGAYWSEENVDGSGSRNTPADRRFLLSSGPFRMNPGDVQEIVYGIVWARAGDRLASVAKMKSDDALAQAAFDVNFQLPPPPDAPQVTVGEYDRTVTLTWGYPPNSNNYLESYDVLNPFLVDVPDEDAPDKTYTFEGYRIFRYDTPQQGDADGTLVATFDVPNDVTTITDTQFDEVTGVPITVVVARGTDSGVRHSISFENLTNYQEYYYGVQAYAYNEFSSPKLQQSPVTRVTAVPRKVGTLAGGTDIQEEEIERRKASGEAHVVGVRTGAGEGEAYATIVNPTALTGDTYEVRFYEHCWEEEEEAHKAGSMTEEERASREEKLSKSAAVEVCGIFYDIVNATTGTKVFDGVRAFESTGAPPPQRDDVVVIDGLSFSVLGPPKQLVDIDQYTAEGTRQNSLDFALSGPPCGAGSDCRFFITAQGAGDPASILGRVDWLGNVALEAPVEYELRFVENPEVNGQIAFVYNAVPGDADYLMKGWKQGPELNEDGSYAEIEMGNGRLPFQLWRLDPLAGTEEQVHVSVLDDDGDFFWGLNPALAPATFGNAPATYERIYGTNMPYSEENLEDQFVQFYNDFPDAYTFGRVLFVPFGGHAMPPAPGVNVRFVTSKPNLPGDFFTLDTDGLGTERGVAEELEANLDAIGIVPNPYKGASNYEVSVTDDVVRFTNLPDEARIRVYTVSGTLVWEAVRGAANNSWDLTTSEGLPLASGMYLVVVDVEGVGTKTIKFGVVKKRIQLDLL